MIFKVVEWLFIKGVVFCDRGCYLGLNIIYCFICIVINLLVIVIRFESEGKGYNEF